MLRARFGLDERDATTPGSLAWGIVLACHCMTVRHGTYLARLREQGGSLTLLAAVQPVALVGLRITPDMGRLLHELGMTIKIEVPSGQDSNLALN